MICYTHPFHSLFIRLMLFTLYFSHISLYFFRFNDDDNESTTASEFVDFKINSLSINSLACEWDLEKQK